MNYYVFRLLCKRPKRGRPLRLRPVAINWLQHERRNGKQINGVIER